MATDQPTIFISYAHEDVEWKDRLVKQLNVLEAEGILDVWDDSEIGPGQDWNAEIERRIQTADVAILLISADFLTSKFIKANEIPPLLERRQRDGVTIFPVILRNCPWKKVSWLASMQVRPTDGRPIASGDDNQIDADLTAIAEELHDILHREPAPAVAAVVPARSRRPNIGPIVSKLCDRLKQTNAFDAFFRECRRTHPHRPQFYVLPGPEGEGHESLVERLIVTRISHFAQEIWGAERGKVDGRGVRVPWPEAEDPELQKRNLPITLFREFDPNYLGEDLSANAFSRLGRFTLEPLVVVQHDILGADWNDATADLIRWYVDPYWGELEHDLNRPQFLIFLTIAYPQDRSTGLSRLFKRRTFKASGVRRQVEAIAADESTKCPVLVFEDLEPITVDDVKKWFKKNDIYDSPKKQRELAETLFHDVESMPMDEIVEALDDILKDVRRETAASYGNLL